MRTIAVALLLAMTLGMEVNLEPETTPLEMKQQLDEAKVNPADEWITEVIPYYPQPWDEPQDEWEV